MNKVIVYALATGILLVSGCGGNKEVVEKAQFEQTQNELQRKEKMLQERQSELLELKNKIIILNAEIKDQQKQIKNLLQITDSLEYRIGVEAKQISAYEERLNKADSAMARLIAEKEALEAQLTGNQQQIKYTLEAKATKKSDQHLGAVLSDEPLTLPESIVSNNIDDLQLKAFQLEPEPGNEEVNDEPSVAKEMHMAIEPVMQITDAEFRERYDEALKLYFSRQCDKAIIEFEALIALSTSHDLADNCQYWIGESYYSKGEFLKAIDAFAKVQTYDDSNKKDHSQYKIGASYLKLERKKDALQAFKKLVETYPDSDMVPKVREMISSGTF
ncbi:MAG TPA: tetratricopeptide repeat protein [Candidatus Marinimicrobia bacterium]|nr:tetratricopeptide repeat protein [Candidatus Neomarinimicrobiota bacterium]